MTIPRWPISAARLNLRNRRSHPAEDRHHRQRNETIAGFVPFRHRIVVGLNTGKLELRIVILMKRAGIIGKENLGVYAIGVESLETLPGR